MSPISSSWSATLEDATKKCEELLSTDGALRRDILKATRERKTLLESHCQQEWGKVCANLSPAKPSTWKTLHNIVSARPTPTNLVVEDGREIPLQSTANRFVSFFKKKSTRHPLAEVPERPPRPTTLLRPISRQELEDAIKCVTLHTACGPDDVYNEALANLPKVARTALLRTF